MYTRCSWSAIRKVHCRVAKRPARLLPLHRMVAQCYMWMRPPGRGRCVLLSILLLLASLMPGSSSTIASDKTFAPLSLYEGTWHVTRHNQPATAQPEELNNTCAALGRYFACQLTVNGQPSELMVYVPAGNAGSYYTQSIMPDGRAAGHGGLTIEGNTWTYTNSWNQGAKITTYFKTVNTFAGKDRIHFEQQESSDRNNWKTTNSGEQLRVNAGKKSGR